MYLDYRTLEKKRINLGEVVSFIRETALASGKYQAVFTRDQLLDGRANGPLGILASNGYNAERGGDLVLIPKPYVVPGAGKTGTTHGSAYAYDTHVPVFFYGFFSNQDVTRVNSISPILSRRCASHWK